MTSVTERPLLEISNLRVSHGGVPALSGISLQVPVGKFVVLAGGNGSGKSTTLRAIAGLEAADAGSMRFEGQTMHKLPAHKRVPLGISLVPEGRRLFPRLTVRRNLELGAFTRSDADEVADSIDEMFGLFPILKQRERQLAGTMSGGEQQMLAIARALMSRPKLLMLDEPSWGIAPELMARVLEVIQRVNAMGVSILLVEQDLHKALSIAHHGYVIQTGCIVLEGSGEALLANQDIKKVCLGL